jgi:class 3 adenylate cyclase/TolB-like protein/tetratricopeptide (TPR) repeat protein
MDKSGPNENLNIHSHSIRKLAVIMFTDIAGFTTVMGEDGDLGMELIHANRKLQHPLIKKHGGKLLKEIGDGTLVQFESAYQALKCGMEIQQNAVSHLKEKIRIGIHSGDVTVEENDIFGDGVNVASRLESVAIPGSIYVSGSIKRAVRGNTDINLLFIDKFKLKNVSDEIEVYAVRATGIVLPDVRKIRARKHKGNIRKRRVVVLILIAIAILFGGWYLFNKFILDPEFNVDSIAVLPFDNYTGEEELDLLMAGLHDQLITLLSQISSLRVISKTSAMKYADKDKSMPEIADELNVDAVVETSVSRNGDSLLINTQVIQASPEERHLWAEIYTGGEQNIQLIMNQIATAIVEHVDLPIVKEGMDRLEKAEETDPEAYKAYLNGMFHANTISPAGFQLAIDYFERSLDIDPGYAPAYAGIAYVWIARLQMKRLSYAEAVPLIFENIQQALELDPNYPESNYIMALASGQAWNWEKSEKAFKKAIDLNPNHVLAHAHYSHLLMMLNRPDEAFKQCEIALKLDPLNDFIMTLVAGVYMNGGREEEGIRLVRKAYEINPQSILTRGGYTKSYVIEGNYEKAFELFAQNLDHDSVLSAEVRKEFKSRGWDAAMGKLASLLESSPGSKDIRSFRIARLYYNAGAYEKALDWFEKAYEVHHIDLAYTFWPDGRRDTVRTDPRYAPRFRALAEKMGLPY